MRESGYRTVQRASAIGGLAARCIEALAREVWRIEARARIAVGSVLVAVIKDAEGRADDNSRRDLVSKTNTRPEVVIVRADQLIGRLVIDRQQLSESRSEHHIAGRRNVQDARDRIEV